MKQILVLALLVFAGMADPRPIQGQAAAEEWVRRYDGSTASEDKVSKLVVGPAGDVIGPFL